MIGQSDFTIGNKAVAHDVLLDLTLSPFPSTMRSILLLSLFAISSNAAVLPAFRVQQAGEALSTDLITNCGEKSDILK